MNSIDFNLAKLSIVLPCHNEEDVIEESYNVLSGLLLKWKGVVIDSYEIVMVNNGSTDRTIDKMTQLALKDHSIVVIDLQKNYGYQGSITAGLFHADADVIVSIDADLQDDPEKIEEMMSHFYNGYELVLGVRSSRASDSFFKRVSSQWFYKLSNKLGMNTVYNHGDFRLMSRRLVENFKNMQERNRFIRSMVLELDSKYATVHYSRTKRKAGKSNFNFFSLTKLALDGITSFSVAPIRLVSMIGMGMFFLSLAGLAYILFVKLIVGVQVPGWAFITVGIFFFGGIQNLSLGIIGEYISKIYTEVKQRPLFSVRKIIRGGQAT